MFFGDNGDTITAFESFELRDTYVDPLGSCDFVLRPTRPDIARYREGLQKGSEISWHVNGHPQASCIIQTVTISVDANGGVVFRVHAESLLATAYQASVDPDIAKHFAADTAISAVVLDVLRPYGFDTIYNDTAASRAAMSGKPLDGAAPGIEVAALKAKDAKANEQETAYGFCARLFSRLGVVLRTGPHGALEIGEPDYEQAPVTTLVQSFTGALHGKHILELTIEDTNDDQFSECVVRGVQADTEGQTQASQPIARVAVTDAPSSGTEFFAKTKRVDLPFGGHAYKSAAYPYKPKIVRDKDARDQKRCQSVATLAMGSRVKSAYVVTALVDGFLDDNGRVWTVDTMVSAILDVDKVNERLWILERTLLQDASGGQKTRLKLIPKGALVLGGST